MVILVKLLSFNVTLKEAFNVNINQQLVSKLSIFHSKLLVVNLTSVSMIQLVKKDSEVLEIVITLMLTLVSYSLMLLHVKLIKMFNNGGKMLAV